MAAKFDLGGFEPCNGVHAIVACTVTLKFGRPLLPQQWSVIKESALEIADKFSLGVPQPFYGFSVQFGSEKIDVSLGAPNLNVMDAAGLVFATIGPSGDLIERIIIANDCILFMNGSYVRWAPFFGRISEMLGIAYNKFIGSIPFSGVKTEYWDRFDQTSSEPADTRKIISCASGMIAPAAADSSLPWHSDAARFVHVTEELRRLERVRVELTQNTMPAGTRQVLSLYTVMDDSLNAPGCTPVDGLQIPLDRALGIMQDQHVALKRLMHGVITAQASDRLGLEIT